MSNLTSVSLLVVLGLQSACGLADDIIVADFEGKSYGEWVVKGTAFGRGPARGTLPGQMEVSGYRGRGLVNSFRGSDKSLGTMTSPAFKIDRNFVAFLIGGGTLPDDVGIELLVDGKVVRTATGPESELLHWHTWDVREFKGKQVKLRIFDKAIGGWGHINVDQIMQTDRRRSGAGTWRLEDYRKSQEYYRELYRPQFHFSPEINWANDPNGLVYFKGEYHLFYQHNPHGNSWGHMSWGHAVSRDLVHWQHLPIALHEEYGVMAFSGCAVVDWKNTSGFSAGDEPPLVAIYTGHGHGRQTQDLAFSNDRGRTWTKYTGNPVLDIGERDFRDPKVFWHDATNRWIMVVSLAVQKKLQFYASPDLKQWQHLSDFGPAGATKKPNWECPDLFELPIEGEAGKTKWVLEVDMGGESIAGGSGGEYFIGDFDGEKFTAEDEDTVRWVDYGRDFYAPVSWSDIPADDGRRIWLGWMNNWETNMLPTQSWRGSMSIPRSLSLRRTKTGLRMIQRPVEELRELRGKPVQLTDVRTKGGDPIIIDDPAFKGERFELVAEFGIGQSSEIGIQVRKDSGGHATIGYDVLKQQAFVDRTLAGEDDFHPRFRGRHAGPLPTRDKVRLHIFVDSSSIELFAGDGEVVITDRIFPKPTSQSIAVYSKGAPAVFDKLTIWPLKSIWK